MALLANSDILCMRHDTFNVGMEPPLNISPEDSAFEPMHSNGGFFCLVDQILIKILHYTVDISLSIHAYFEELLEDLIFHNEEVAAENEKRRQSIREKRASIKSMMYFYDGKDSKEQFTDIMELKGEEEQYKQF
jgi:hypothetical protein